MEKQKKTKGIVLRRFNLNEADQIVTVLTEDEGKVSLLAKGSRRLKSKFCGRLEPFYHVSLNYFQGRELGHLDEADRRFGIGSAFSFRYVCRYRRHLGAPIPHASVGHPVPTQ
jgi:DNA repair protein RecO (recombination protein O)